jgi:hypothetical protein
MSGVSEWYMAIGGHQVGPVTAEEIVANLRNGTIDAATLAFRQGMASWTPIRDVPEFRVQAAAPSAAALAVPAVPADGARTRSASRSTARTCSSSRSSSIPARARWRKRAR